jgi:hypothetical protein
MTERSGPIEVLQAAATHVAINTYYDVTNTITMGRRANSLRLFVTSAVSSPGEVSFRLTVNNPNNADLGAAVFYDYCTDSEAPETFGPLIFTGAAQTKVIVLRGLDLIPLDVIRVSYAASANAAGATVAIIGESFHSDLGNSDVSTGDIEVAIESIDVNLEAVEQVQGDSVGASGIMQVVEAKDIDGSALPNAVTEGQVVRPAATLYGGTIATVTTEDGSYALRTLDDPARRGYVQITDGTTNAAVIATILSQKTDTSSVAGTVTTVNSGNKSAGSQRIVIATDDINMAKITAAVEIMDDWDETNRAKVNPIAGQAGIAANTGVMDVLTTRITLATNDAQYGEVGAAANVAGTVHAQLRTIGTAVELLDDAIYVDDATWTNDTSKHCLIGGIYQSTPQAITDGKTGPLSLDANGMARVSIGAQSLTAVKVSATAAANTATNPLFSELTDGGAVISTTNPLSVNLTDGTSAMLISDANTGRATGNHVLSVQGIGADGTVAPTGSAVSNAPFAKVTDGTNFAAVGTGTTKTLSVGIHDGELLAAVKANTAMADDLDGINGLVTASVIHGYVDDATTRPVLVDATGHPMVDVAVQSLTALKVSATAAANTNANPLHCTLTDGTTAAVITAGLTALKVDLVGEGGAALAANNPLFSQLTDGANAIAAGNPLNIQIGDGTTQAAVIATLLSLKTDTSSIGGTAYAIGTAAMAASQPFTLATDDTQFGTVGAAADPDGNIHGQLRSIADAVEIIDDAVGAHDSAAAAGGVRVQGRATAALAAAVDDGDDAQINTDLNQQIRLASHVIADTADTVKELDPVSEHYSPVTVLFSDEAVVADPGVSYAPDANGHALTFGHQAAIQLYLNGGTEGGPANTTVTVTIEASMGLLVAAAVRWIDVSKSCLDLNTGLSNVASWSSTGDNPTEYLLSLAGVPFTHFRVKYDWDTAPDNTDGAIVVNMFKSAL